MIKTPMGRASNEALQRQPMHGARGLFADPMDIAGGDCEAPEELHCARCQSIQQDNLIIRESLSTKTAAAFGRLYG